MVALDFDTSNIDTSDFSPVPPGIYDGEIVAAEQRTSATGNEYLSLQIRLGNNRLVFDNLNLWHKTSEAAVEIAKKKLAEIEQALGTKIRDSEQMLCKALNFRIGVQKDDATKNEVLSYMKPDDMPSPPTQAHQAESGTSASNAAPWRS